MPDRAKVFDAFRNCITEPKCKDCPWETCEEFHQTKKILLDLCLDILELLKEQEQDRIEIAHEVVSNSILMYQGKELVRCKDCKYCVKEPNKELYCDILAVGYEPLGSKKVSGDWFCADGERQEGR